MVTAVLVWVGVVLGLGLLLVMALGPVIVEIDAKVRDRREDRREDRRHDDARAHPVPAL